MSYPPGLLVYKPVVYRSVETLCLCLEAKTLLVKYLAEGDDEYVKEHSAGVSLTSENAQAEEH